MNSRWLVRTALVAGPLAAASASGAPVESEPLVIGERLVVRSESLGESRTVRVVLPDGYADNDRRFPVLYVFDGESLTLTAAAATAKLAEYALAPEMIVVGIDNTDRMRDLTPRLVEGERVPPGLENAGGADAFVRFVTDELWPTVESRYRAAPARVVVGHSLGGLFVTHLLTREPGRVFAVVSLDPTLSWADRATAHAAAALLDEGSWGGRLVSVEGRGLDGWRADPSALKQATSRGRTAELLNSDGEPHGTMPHSGIFQGIKRVFRDYPASPKSNPGRGKIENLKAQYGALSAAYGWEVTPPLGAMVGIATRAFRERRFSDAERALTEARRLYAEAGPALDARLDEVRSWRERVPEAAAPVYEPLSAYTEDSAAPFLGLYEATGDRPGFRTRTVLEWRDGELVGWEEVSGPNGLSFRVDHEAHRIDGQTIEWDCPNRGGGYFVTTLTRRPDGSLEGTTIIKGIDVPPGATNTPQPVALRRVGGG